MVESVGKKLLQARQKRSLTIEEVAHVTKLRPDKIVALETDDYSSFPSNAYAKGFLQIYARYLNVDVSEFLSSLESSNSISVDDYQYLSNAPAPKPVQTERRDERRPPSIAPLVFFVFVLLLGATVWWFLSSYQRTIPSHASDTEDTTSKSQQQSASSSASHSATQSKFETPEKPQAPQPAPKPAISSVPKPAATSDTVPAPASSPAPKFVVTAPAPSATPEPGGVVQIPPPTSPLAVPTPRTGSSALSDRDFVNPTAVPTPETTAFTEPRGGLNEVQVASVKKTWVTIRRDNPKAAPIFEDYIYPNTNPLKIKGARFFIDARDPSAVQITMNGLPFAYPNSNTPVQ
jgi:cytoskeletal protein RodZ